MQPAEAWGRVFEIAVKRGVLACLMHRKLLAPNRAEIERWRTLRTSRVYTSTRIVLDWHDDERVALCDGVVRHLLLLGYGIGWTCIREWLSHIPKRTKRLQSLWCPLSLPGDDGDDDAQAFRSAFGIQAPDGDLIRQGGAARSDFTALFTDAKGRRQQLLVLEISFNALAVTPDFSDERAHVDEIARYGKRLELRGVFSHVRAEVEGPQLSFSADLANHLTAFSGRDKPFFKLCQGASYAAATVDLLRSNRPERATLDAQVLAVTSMGVESLSADMSADSNDARADLMRGLGEAYRRKVRVPDEDADRHLLGEIQDAFTRLVRGLPKGIRKQLREMARAPEPGEPVHWAFDETVPEFFRPTDRVSVSAALDYVPDDASLMEFFGRHPRSELEPLLERRARDGLVSLRDLHGAAVEAGLNATAPGRLNLLALEGNPGIGKTTAVQQYLTNSARDGFLMLYFSPRTVINRDVTDKFARDRDGRPTGIITITTDKERITQAQSAFASLRPEGEPFRTIDAAVVVDGDVDITMPERGSTWFVSPEVDEQVTEHTRPRGDRKRGIDERTEELSTRRAPGVLRTLASAAASLAKANPSSNRLVITASIQSYRRTPRGSTIDALSHLFQNGVHTPPGLKERRRFAERFPSILVMVDEIAGDGAGALFVRDISSWLDAQFVEPFTQDASPPFRVSLVIADASLGNEAVLESYLKAVPEAPQKVIISPVTGREPFRLATSRIPGLAGNGQALHVMTNSYPASALEIAYRVKLHRIEQEQDDSGRDKSLRARIRSQGGEALLDSASAEILDALQAGAQQIIFFAQDKAFLRELRGRVVADCSEAMPGITRETVAELHSSLNDKERRRLVQPACRDRQRVFLMTSSGARGVSFPRATHIIAMVPRFDVASNLMELAQLIYRGRGSYRHPETNEERSGDDSPRRLTLLVDDWLPVELDTEDRRIWLQRVSDLLTLVMMLRSTVLTRITGDAGLHEPLALVPVGPIISEEQGTSLAEPLRSFIREAQAQIAGPEGAGSKGLINDALEKAASIFKAYRLEGVAPPSDSGAFRSWTDVAKRQAFAAAVTARAGMMLSDASDDTTIPETCHCPGPVWLEDWSDLRNKEHFRLGGSKAVAEEERKLLKQLWAIAENRSLGRPLRRSAYGLHDVLRSELDQRHVTQKELGHAKIWLALPLDWPMSTDQSDRAKREPRYAEEWHSGLQAILAARGQAFPVLPVYEELPFVATISGAAPDRLAQAMSSQYFMASNELNLLNTVLLSASDQR